MRHQQIMESCNGLATCTCKHISRNACGRNKFVTTTRASWRSVATAANFFARAWAENSPVEHGAYMRCKNVFAININIYERFVTTKTKQHKGTNNGHPPRRVEGHGTFCEGVCFIGILFFVCFYHVLPYAHEFVEHFF